MYNRPYGHMHPYAPKPSDRSDTRHSNDTVSPKKQKPYRLVHRLCHFGTAAAPKQYGFGECALVLVPFLQAWQTIKKVCLQTRDRDYQLSLQHLSYSYQLMVLGARHVLHMLRKAHNLLYC